MTTNEETLYKTNGGQNIEQNVDDITPLEKVEKQKESNNDAARIVATGAVSFIAGGLMGGGVAYSAARQSPINITEDSDVDRIKVVTENDSLAFGEAFNDARVQTGPGGVFRWRGGLYNTYTEREWKNMSAAEKAEFAAKVEPLASGSERMASTYVNNAHHNTTNHPQHKQPSLKESDDSDISKKESETLQGDEVVIGRGVHDGRTMFVVDIDQDGKYNIVEENFNRDRQITETEIVDIRNQNIEVSNKNFIQEASEPDDKSLISNDLAKDDSANMDQNFDDPCHDFSDYAPDCV